ncbi:hypothetical protein Ancab_013721 [Ancistrocladus abbreviatus]
MIKTLFSPDSGSHDGKSNSGSITEVKVAEKVFVIGKGSEGSVNGGKQRSPSREFVAGDGSNKCSINDAGQDFCLAELKDSPSGPNSTGYNAQQAESMGRSPETLGLSPESFKEGSDHVDREVTPSSQRMPLKPTISPTKAVYNMKYVSAMTPMKKHLDKSAFTGMIIIYLNRLLTEEWKGWAKVCTWMTSRAQLNSSGGAGFCVCSVCHHVLLLPSSVVLWVNDDPLCCDVWGVKDGVASLKVAVLFGVVWS